MHLHKKKVGTLLRNIIAGAMAIASLGTLPAHAETFETLRSKGKIIVGIQPDNPPWGFMDAGGKNAGFDADFARMLGDKIGVPVQFESITVSNRIPTLLTGKVDMLIALVGMYPDRAKVVQFTEPYSTNDIILLAHPDAKILSPADLVGVRISASRSSAADTQITKNAPAGAIIQRFDDDSTTIQAFVSGQVDALVGASTFPLNIAKIAPDFKFEQKLQFSRQFNGIAVRPGQKELVDQLNSFIREVKADGRLEALYQKWVGTSAPAFPDKIDGVPYSVE